MRRVIATLVVLGLMLAAPAVAAARVVASFGGAIVAGPALSSDGRLVIGERLGSGDIPAVVVDPSGARAQQTLATFPAARADRTFTALTLTGTGGVVGAQVDTRMFNDPKTGGAETHASTGRSLLPSAVLVTCRRYFTPTRGVQVVGGTGFTATIGDECSAIGRTVRVHDTGGAVRTLAVAPGAQPSLLRAAGPYVAWAETAPGVSAVVLARAATGEVLMRAPVSGSGAEDIGLGSDGTIAWITYAIRRGCTGLLSVASAAQPVPRTLAAPELPCPFGTNRYASHGALAVAGGRIVYPSSPAYAVLDAGGAHTVGELNAPNGAPGPIAFDGRTLYGIRSECDGDRLLAVDVTVPGTPPAAIAPDGPDCPAARRGSARRRLDSRTHALSVPLSCPAGCRGTLRLVQVRALRERAAARTDISGRGAFTVRLQPARFASALAACGNGVRLRATLYRDHPQVGSEYPRQPLQLGVLRVRSSGRCRHVAGPPFERRATIP